jgi:hypothetical protein
LSTPTRLTPAQRRFIDTLLAQGYHIPPFGRAAIQGWNTTAAALEAAGLIRVQRLGNASGWEARLELPAPAWIVRTDTSWMDWSPVVQELDNLRTKLGGR